MQSFSADRIHCYPGPLAVEEALVQWVDNHRARSFDELAAPLRIVVPSRSLRRHVLALLPRRLGALAGVVVQTHRAVAREVVEGSGAVLPANGGLVQDLLIRRFAVGQPELATILDGLEDGYSAAVASVRDLLDAGLEPFHKDAASDAIDSTTLGPDSRERALALVNATCACAQAQQDLDLPGPSTLLSEATRLLDQAGPTALACRGMLIHGFADATGRVTDLLEALVEQLGAELFLDHPPDSVDPAQRDVGWSHTSRIVDRIAGAGAASGISWASPADHHRSLNAFVAPTAEHEIREAARRIRAELDAEAQAERIAVVVRSIDAACATSIRRHFARLGIPLSGEATTVCGGVAARRAQTLVELLSDGSQARTSAWLEATNPETIAELPTTELALRSLGARTLEQTAEIEPIIDDANQSMRLPVVERVEEAGEHDKLIRLHIGRASLEDIRKRAETMIETLRTRPERATARKLFEWIGRCLETLGWRPGDNAGDALLETIETFSLELPGELEIRWREMQPLLQKALLDASVAPLGGRGGGVQVLSVMEARSRTFEHLFVVGLNRGVFPRQVDLDPLLGETARQALSAVLPDIPLKERGRVEERFLFAQLMASSPRITLSHHASDASGADRNPSVFIELLRLEGLLNETPIDDGRTSEPQTPAEGAVAAGLGGDRGLLGALCELAEPESAGQVCAVLDAQDPALPADDLGAFLGVTGIGPSEELWVTHLERFVQCPWQQFLIRRLGLTLPPASTLADASLDGWLVGQVVHGVLEDMVRDAEGFVDNHLDAVRRFDAKTVVWPNPERLAELIRERSQRRAIEEGVPAITPALEIFSKAYLERVRLHDWPDGKLDVLGAEITGRVILEHDDGLLDIRFRADRVDREEGELVLTDYKTSSPSGVAAKTAIPRGEMLQGAAYAAAAGAGGIGRYLVLKEGVKTPDLRVGFNESDQLANIANEIVAAWRTGIWFPRLTNSQLDKEGPKCRYCRVKSACMQDDSGVRARLARFMETSTETDDLKTLWLMPERKASRGR